jgi:hypothetical protein
VARSRNHCCPGNATVHSLILVELHVIQQCKSSECCTEVLLWRIDVAANSETHVGFRVKCSNFCPVVTKLRFARQSFVNSPSIKLHKEPRVFMRADGRDKASRLFLRRRRRLKIAENITIYEEHPHCVRISCDLSDTHSKSKSSSERLKFVFITTQIHI